MRTSDHIAFGGVYARDDLRAQFGITDATINTGVFRPKGHDSIWLFVTEHKTADRTQYADRLESESLFWQGQISGRSDPTIIEHAANGLELLLFYRRKKYEFPKAGFRFTGIFEYVSHFGKHPTSFLLHRLGQARAPNYSPARNDAPRLTVQEERKWLGSSQPSTLNEIITWLAGMERVTEADLRNCLLPLDLLPAAFIDELNERALDLTGEIALEESGEEIIVVSAPLAAIITNQE